MLQWYLVNWSLQCASWRIGYRFQSPRRSAFTSTGSQFLNKHLHLSLDALLHLSSALSVSLLLFWTVALHNIRGKHNQGIDVFSRRDIKFLPFLQTSLCSYPESPENLKPSNYHLDLAAACGSRWTPNDRWKQWIQGNHHTSHLAARRPFSNPAHIFAFKKRPYFLWLRMATWFTGICMDAVTAAKHSMKEVDITWRRYVQVSEHLVLRIFR